MQRARPAEDVSYGLDGGDFLLVFHAEGRAAAAGRDDVRVVDLEAGALHALDVVDDRALDVGQARAVDEDAQAVVLEDRVAVALVSNASAYWKPEQPPPRTPTRRPDVCTSRALGRRNSWTFSAPFSVKVITCVLPCGRPVQYFPKCSDRYALVRCPPPTTSSSASRPQSPASRPRSTDLTGSGDHFRATVVARRVRRDEPHRAASPCLRGVRSRDRRPDPCPVPRHEGGIVSETRTPSATRSRRRSPSTKSSSS